MGCPDPTPEEVAPDRAQEALHSAENLLQQQKQHIQTLESAAQVKDTIVQKLEANPNAFGIFGFSFLDQNSDKIKGAMIDGVAPTFDNIADGKYPVSRPLYVYVKKAHIGTIPGIAEFLAEFTNDNAWGEDGYLTDKGLIPMPDAEREAFAAAAANQTNLKL